MIKYSKRLICRLTFASVLFILQAKLAVDSSNQLGLSVEEIAFYDALTKPQAVKDFYDNDQLVAITKDVANPRGGVRGVIPAKQSY